MLGQRWEYQIGNSIVYVDNAFSWSLWGQERLIINDETAHASSGWMRFRQNFAEPWLTALGDELLAVTMKSRALSILCLARVGDEPLAPIACYTARWTGRAHGWPAPQEWREVATNDAIAFG